ncbi:MAG: PTS sugar transporter subunit IIA [Treponema sp.]|jgi:PTS system nitrogen regulatory IIA component|nr:PTS sugar transporter subunit IIA [Treponema sp.]
MNDISLVDLIKKGGALLEITGSTPKEALDCFIQNIRLPADLPADVLLQAVLERESLMATSIGGGIAVPHPRNPLLSNESEQFIAIAFLKRPVEWQALDGVPVQNLILLVSSSARAHLHSLSRVHFLCQEEAFCSLLAKKASKEEIIKTVGAIEKEWEEKAALKEASNSLSLYTPVSEM